MQAVDQAVRFVQVASQDVRDGVLAGVAASARASDARLSGLELVRYLGNLAVQLTQQ
jgi:hypothetical protein